MSYAIWYHFYNLKNVKNTPEEVSFLVKLQAKPTTLLKVTLFHGCFSRFLNCTNGTKLRNASHIAGFITIINKSNTNTIKPSSERSSRPEVFYKINILKSFSKLTENTCARVNFPENFANF